MNVSATRGMAAGGTPSWRSRKSCWEMARWCVDGTDRLHGNRVRTDGTHGGLRSCSIGATLLDRRPDSEYGLTLARCGLFGSVGSFAERSLSRFQTTLSLPMKASTPPAPNNLTVDVSTADVSTAVDLSGDCRRCRSYLV